MATTDQELNRIATLLEKQADIWQKHFGVPDPATPDDLLTLIRKNTKLFSDGRAAFRTNAAVLATAIGAKLKDAAQRGLCNEIPLAKLVECFKSSGAAFDRKMLGEFTGVSRGAVENVDTAMGAITPPEPDNEKVDKELDTWEGVTDDKGSAVQNVTYERLKVRDGKPPERELIGRRVNTHRPDTGLAAWQLNRGGDQRIYWGYPVDKDQDSLGSAGVCMTPPLWTGIESR